MSSHEASQTGAGGYHHWSAQCPAFQFVLDLRAMNGTVYNVRTKGRRSFNKAQSFATSCCTGGRFITHCYIHKSAGRSKRLFARLTSRGKPGEAWNPEPIIQYHDHSGGLKTQQLFDMIDRYSPSYIETKTNCRYLWQPLTEQSLLGEHDQIWRLYYWNWESGSSRSPTDDQDASGRWVPLGTICETDQGIPMVSPNLTQFELRLERKHLWRLPFSEPSGIEDDWQWFLMVIQIMLCRVAKIAVCTPPDPLGYYAALPYVCRPPLPFEPRQWKEPYLPVDFDTQKLSTYSYSIFDL